MAKAAETKAVVAANKDDNLPAYLQGVQKTSRIGNIDQSDLIIPRIKLLQAISPEVEAFENAKSGEFWHTIAGMSLGKELSFVPILLRKSWVLWAPRGDDRGILARANDGKNWDQPDMEFTVKPKGSPKPIIWRTAKTVAESGLDQFGSSIPDDPNSPPAAALTYQFLVYFPEYADFGPTIVLNTRSQIKPAKDLINKCEIRPVDHYCQKYRMSIVQEKGTEGPYFNYQYVPDGYADEATAKKTKEWFEYYSKASFRANDENEDTAAPATSSRF